MSYWRERSVPYAPGQKNAFKLSRSKIELFMQCKRCFWLDARLKIKRPDTPPFRINQAIDELFKKEFDTYRKEGKPHPLMLDNQIKAIPYSHEKLDDWRHNFTGVVYVHPETNLHIFGAVDDIWVNEDDELIVVDYKATSKDRPVSISADWQISYKRQMEVYQWLLRQNGFKVNATGYFVYTNGRLDMDAFNDRLEFTTKVIPYIGNDGWVAPTIQAMKDCMEGDMPEVGDNIMGGPCAYCTYARQRTELTIQHLKNRK